MSQRWSEYDRKDRDLYETPEWVTKALIPYIPKRIKTIWEPSAGNGKITEVFRKHAYKVYSTDIHTNHDNITTHFTVDFLQTKENKEDAIITNPPYNLATQFAEHALNLFDKEGKGFLALLLRMDFDCAKTRKHLFGQNVHWSRKLTLTKRIRWFPGTKGSPSFNHAWFIWDYDSGHEKPEMSYYYEDKEKK